MVATTIIGIKINCKKFFTYDEMINNCKCKNNDSTKFKYCPDCSKENNIVIKTKRFHPDLSNKHHDYNRVSDYNRLSEYKLHHLLDTENNVYVYIWKGINYGPNENQLVQCPYSFEELIKKRENLKTYLISNKFVDDKEFDKFFGIHTLTSY